MSDGSPPKVTDEQPPGEFDEQPPDVFDDQPPGEFDEQPPGEFDDTRADDSVPEVDCDHEPAVGYEVAFTVQDGVDEIDSACVMEATLQQTAPTDPAADAVGCAVEDCTGHHDAVAASLQKDAARHSGNVAPDDC